MYITLEGIDGSGKSTQFHRIKNMLRKHFGENQVGICHYNSMNNFIGRLIKVIELKINYVYKWLFKYNVIKEILLGSCARLNILKTKKIYEKILLSDRSVFTAFAYNYNKLPYWFIKFIEPKMVPDLVFYLEIGIDQSVERLIRRKNDINKTNRKKIFDISLGYKNIINKNRPSYLKKSKIVVVNALLSEQEISNYIFNTIIEIVKKQKTK